MLCQSRLCQVDITNSYGDCFVIFRPEKLSGGNADKIARYLLRCKEADGVFLTSGDSAFPVSLEKGAVASKAMKALGRIMKGADIAELRNYFVYEK